MSTDGGRAGAAGEVVANSVAVEELAAGLSVEGPSFPVAIRIVASAMMAGLLAGLISSRHELLAAQDGSPSGWAVLALLFAMVASGYWTVMASRTSIDSGAIRQRGLWSREVRFDEIQRVKLVAIPGLEWILVPRLVVRGTGAMTLATFQAGDRGLFEAFRRLAGR